MNAKTLQRGNSDGVFLPIGNVVFAFKKEFHPINMALKLKKRPALTLQAPEPGPPVRRSSFLTKSPLSINATVSGIGTCIVMSVKFSDTKILRNNFLKSSIYWSHHLL